ncbi:MAG: Protease HtpX [Chlamydiae bacterium]|nr:Protease HtpX [Chlamydiota bacterium]
MQFFKRIFLFLIVNILVLTMVSIVLSIFNVQPYISQYGIQYSDLLIFCLIWGMGGAFISLALSRIMAKWMMGVKVIDPKTNDPHQKKLLDIVHRLAQKARLPEMPEVGIYKSAEVNAFATGPTQRRSIVAVSSGLLEHMSKDQIEGVLAHEITHITNGDMVTMTLLQGVVNVFVMFLARVLALILSGFGRGDRRGSYGSFVLFTILFQLVFMVLGTLVVFWYSRKREYRADAGGAHLAGKEKMISALEGLKTYVKRRVPTAQKESLQTFKISTPTKTGWALLFASHPPLEMRIEKLKELRH